MGYEWSFAVPEEVGMDSKILEEIDHYIHINRYRLVRSVLVVKEDQLVIERYFNGCNENSRHQIHSVTKSFVSTAVGISIKQGIITNIEIPLAEVIPEHFGGQKNPLHRYITLKNLLTMSSGIYWNNGIHFHNPIRPRVELSNNWLDMLSDFYMTDYPGTKFYYKEPDVCLVWEIIKRLSGRETYDILKEHLYEPLGFSVEPWVYVMDGSNKNSAGKEITEEAGWLCARDMAKLGLLYLHKGKYKEKIILSENYVEEATTPYLEDYGYFWWKIEGGFRAIGVGGQEINVFPKLNMVVVIQAEASPQNKFYSGILWDVILKSLK